jgi:ABC-type dipeptide/oligopeptide/nickel transport system permease subunit
MNVLRQAPLISWLQGLIYELARSKSATIGASVILFWVVVAIVAPIIAPYSPTELQAARLQPPSLEHWLGTDHLARDVLSRVLWGTRVVVVLAPVSVLLGILVAAPLGLMSGYVGGRRVCEAGTLVPLYHKTGSIHKAPVNNPKRQGTL